ncbi:MAG: hypothetical protein LUI60_07570 [Clostridia bacterium]|nr:hypothetical protein [Clostridia bacterium]
MKWRTRLVFNRISKVAIITCLAASVTFAGFTIYGSKVGNFVVNVEDTKGSIKLSVDEDPLSETATLTNILSTPVLKKQVDATYNWIPDNIAEGMGSKNDENYRYFAYSFYLVNTGETTIDYDFGAYITETTLSADEIVRFMVIKGEQYTYNEDTEFPADAYKSQGTIYAKTESSEENKAYVETSAGYPAPQVDFLSDTIICTSQESVDGLSCIKYTLVMWIEGYDVDCTDDKIGGTIKMEVNITQLAE